MTRTTLLALKPDRVVIIKPSALGDVVNGFHSLAALRNLWPEARIFWVINRSLRDLVDRHPQIDEVIEYDRKRASLASFGHFLGGLRKRRFDVAIDMQGLLRSGVMTLATGAPIRVGLADAREGARWFYTHRVTAPIDTTHAVDRLLAIASAFGADVKNTVPRVAMEDSDRTWAENILRELPRPRLAINLGARWETKRWPPASFAEIGRRAVRTRGASLVALGAPEDREFVRELALLLDPIPILDLSGQSTLCQLAALSTECDVLLSNDTGPLHLASTAGARVVGIYTCTSPALNGPYGPAATAITSEIWCKASYLVTCARLECMTELTPDRIWPKVLEQLDAVLR